MAETTPYVKQTHVDGGSFNGAKATYIEEGIRAAHEQPAVRVTHSVAQSILNATNTALAFNTERFDTAFGAASTQHDTATNNSRLIARYAGKYQITGGVEFAANATGVRDIFIRLNGATTIQYHRLPSLTAVTAQLAITTLYDMAVNDYVELMVFQNSTAALNVNAAAAYSPEFMMVRVA